MPGIPITPPLHDSLPTVAMVRRIAYDRPMHDWLVLALQKSTVRRALKYAGVVGAVLVTINHGDALWRGEVKGGRWLQMGLTVLVPYVVSTLSSVGALREREKVVE